MSRPQPTDSTAPSAPSGSGHRALLVMFGVVTLVSLWLLTRSWHASLLDRYEFRQLQTALTAHWITVSGWQLDYLTPLFGPPWSIPMEFPTYQLIVAKLHLWTGLPLEQAGRLTGIFFLFASLPALFDLLAITRLPPSRRLVALALVITSPVYLFYARAFMIETTALCFGVWFLACLRRAMLTHDWRWILAASVTAALAGLTKITTFLLFGFPAVVLVVALFLETRRAHAQSVSAGSSHSARISAVRHPLGALLAALIPAVVSLGLAWWWIQHSDVVKDSNPFSGFLTARELRAWNFGTLSLRLDWSFWVHLQENVVEHNLAEGALALAALSAVFASTRVRVVALIGALAFLSGPLVFANLYHIHDYYYTACSLFLLVAAGVMIGALWDNPRVPRAASWVALGLVLTFQLHAFYRGYYSYHRNPAPPPPAFAQVVRDLVPPDGIVVMYGDDWNPLYPYYFQRRTLMIPGGREREHAVIDDVVSRLRGQRIAALVIKDNALRLDAAFVRETTARFGCAPNAFAHSGDIDLFLPVTIDPAALDRAAATPRPSVQFLTQPVLDAFSSALKTDPVPAIATTLFQPAPVDARSQYGFTANQVDGRAVLTAHAPSELIFDRPAGATLARFVVGLPDAAFAPGGNAVTDGVTVEVFGTVGENRKQLLYQRQLDPAKVAGDRGPQTIELALPPNATGQLIFRLGNGPASNPTNDWAYWSTIELR